VAYLAAVGVVTLWPAPPDPTQSPLLERVLAWAHGIGLPEAVDVMVVEAVANVVMFVPLGLLLPWAAGWRPWRAVPAGLALSTAIELTQIALPERVPTVQDVVMNTLGAAVGATAVDLTRRARASRAGRAAAPDAVAAPVPDGAPHAGPQGASEPVPDGGAGPNA